MSENRSAVWRPLWGPQRVVDARYIEGLPEARADKAWGPKEILAHLVYWQEIWVAQAEAIGAAAVSRRAAATRT